MTDQPKFRILCVVSGGVTGRREAWLKSDDDTYAEFTTMEEAQDEARRLTEQRTGNPRAAFTYTARKV